MLSSIRERTSIQTMQEPVPITEYADVTQIHPFQKMRSIIISNDSFVDTQKPRSSHSNTPKL